MNDQQNNRLLLINKLLLFALILSVAFVVVAFLGGEPPSARGFYYLIWLTFTGFLWNKREQWAAWLKKQNLPGFPLFVGLGLIMILLEETIAGITVHFFSIKNALELLTVVPPYYINNLFLLPGFIIAWYILLKYFHYSQTEVFTLVGLFGLFSEKTYLHVLGFPILGTALLLPTMFTYMGIIMPSVVSIDSQGTRRWNKPIRYLIGLVFPVIMSMPFVFVHTLLAEAGLIDPTILTR